MSEYALIGEEQAKYGTLLGAVSEAGFLIGLETNRSDCTESLIEERERILVYWILVPKVFLTV